MFIRKHKSWLLRVGLAASVSLSTVSAFALEPAAELKLMRVGEVQYMSGGANRKERTILDSCASDFHVRISFVGTNEQERVRQVRQVMVTLVNQVDGNTVIRLRTAGPRLLMKLPTGRYTLSATLPGMEPVISQLELEAGQVRELQVVLDAAPAQLAAAF
jgi:hypothetical protein